jgi:hypothetical protein
MKVERSTEDDACSFQYSLYHLDGEEEEQASISIPLGQMDYCGVGPLSQSVKFSMTRDLYIRLVSHYISSKFHAVSEGDYRLG